MRIVPPAIALLLVAAVGNAMGQRERTEGAAGARVDAQVSAAVDNLAIGYRQAAGIWRGFDPRDHPTVVAFRSDGAIAALLAVNHAGADNLGQATAPDTAGTPFRSLHRIAAARSVTRRLGRVEHFEFRMPLGGVDSFVMVADPSRGLDPAEAGWTATYLHEMFHRYQELAFYGPNTARTSKGTRSRRRIWSSPYSKSARSPKRSRPRPPTTGGPPAAASPRCGWRA